MRILVIGGTSFVGRHIAEAAIAHGHDVTVFNRGQTNSDALPQATHLTGDRNSDLSALENGEWDATVDSCAYVPRQVRTLLETLGGRGGHYTFISTISVYPDETTESFTETAPLREPAWDDELTMEKYGELKVACEQVATELAGDRLLVIRPGYVVGPFDPTHRFTYWVERVADGHSPMATPDTAQPLQCIDGRDLAAFTVKHMEAGTVDVFNATGPMPALTFGQVLETIARGVGHSLPELRPVGFDERLPLAAPPSDWALMQADLSKPVGEGLSWRPLEQTVADTLDWVSKARADGRYTPRPGVGLSPQDEANLLASR
jgi:2'-hydroxyisoflavone reductase